MKIHVDSLTLPWNDKKKQKQCQKAIYVSSGLAPGNVIAGRMILLPEVSL